MNAEINLSEATSTWLSIVTKQVESLRFGVVQIVVHENRVVQIEKTEKVRLDKPEPTH
ncbi:MAG TPA: YezD family protein [Candidatus Acidoferrum sp.]|nr:YezD family protein [Candidatus Acidoferrum sp.]